LSVLGQSKDCPYNLRGKGVDQRRAYGNGKNSAGHVRLQRKIISRAHGSTSGADVTLPPHALNEVEWVQAVPLVFV
jgi:hypothetical protein